jgi:hypothetical protein
MRQSTPKLNIALAACGAAASKQLLAWVSGISGTRREQHLFNYGSRRATTARPWRKALRLTRSLPWALRGPELLPAFGRFAAILLFDVIVELYFGARVVS